jgi:phosphoglycolate phosphatase-like HAD superfamily hydrolase
MSAGLSQRYDLVVFDFDGTLCDSVEVKNEAFRLLYLDEQGPEFAEQVHAYHLANMGVSRYDKIRHIESEMIGSAPTEDRVEEVAARFGGIVEEQITAAPLFDGVLEFLGGDSLPMAVASATPTEELRRIITAKGIEGSFAAMEGSPRSKTDIVAAFIDRFADGADRVLVVGDQPSDLAAAKGTGADFVAVIPAGHPDAWAAPYPVVPDFDSFVGLFRGDFP